MAILNLCWQYSFGESSSSGGSGSGRLRPELFLILSDLRSQISLFPGILGSFRPSIGSRRRGLCKRLCRIE